MPDTTLGITYPASTGHTRMWEHLQELAEDVDAIIDADRDLRDGAAGSWTPSVTGSTSGTGTAGNATIQGKYLRSGRIVHAWADIEVGSTTNFGSVSGAMLLSLPVVTDSAQPGTIGVGYIADNSAADRRACVVRRQGTDKVLLVAESGGIVSNSNPWTWATSDVIGFQVTYFAASAP